MLKKKKKYRFTIQLSEDEARMGNYYAEWSDKPLSTFLGQMAAANIRAQFLLILKLLEEKAEHEGISVAELKERWALKEPPVKGEDSSEKLD